MARLPIKIWIQALRLPFTTITLLTVLFGTLLAVNEPNAQFKPILFILSTLGALLFHLAANVTNDYFDDKNGTDKINKEFIAPFCGGSRVIQNNELTRKQVLWLAIILYSLASGVGVALFFLRGWKVLLFGAAALLSGVFYSAFLVRFYLGELIVGIAFGILMISGSYFMQSNTLPPRIILYALPATFLTILIIWINQFPDYTADRKSGKQNLVVRIGRKNSAYIYLILSLLTYLSLFIIGITLNRYFFIPISTLLIAIAIAIKLIKNHDQIKKIGFTLPQTIILHHSVILLCIGALLFALASPQVGIVFCSIILLGCYLFYFKSSKSAQHG